MTYTNIHRMCVVFLLHRRLTRSAICGSQIFAGHFPINGRPCFFATLKENREIPRHVCVDHYILLLNYLSNHMHFKTNGFKRFLKTNSTDPRQRVPLIPGLALKCPLHNKLYTGTLTPTMAQPGVIVVIRSGE